MGKTALITGITGQDGAYLAEYLIKKGYIVHGIKRRSSLLNTDRLDHLYKDPHESGRNLVLHYGDLSDSMNITRIISECNPDEIYNLGAMSHVKVSFDIPEYSANTDGTGALRILEAIRLLGLVKKTRFYQASTSELYGKVREIPQSETTPFYPRSPYGVAKLYAYWITVNYREAYGLHASNGILFNHESPIRGETFVSRKITRGLARILLGMDAKLFMGNLDAKRDWGHAKDYIKAMHLMLQQDIPDDYVIATGVTTEVREFIRRSFAYAGITIEFTGKGESEKGIVTKTDGNRFAEVAGEDCAEPFLERIKKDNVVVLIDPAYYRPSEVDILLGNPEKARRVLGWEPEYNLDMLINEMTASDINLAKRELHLRTGGFRTNNYFE